MVELAQTASFVLVDEEMNVVARARDIHDFAARAVTAADEKAHVLRYFDPYGTLVLNAMQMTDFLADWADARSLICSDHDQDSWDDVRAFAATVQKSNTNFIAILGD